MWRQDSLDGDSRHGVPYQEDTGPRPLVGERFRCGGRPNKDVVLEVTVTGVPGSPTTIVRVVFG